jgi:Protein of unknown function (DUF3224)
VSTQATSTFDIDSWEAKPYDEHDGVTLTRTQVTKTFHGQIEGQSTAELLMVAAPDGSAAYVGFEHIVCRLHERTGSFILHHSATQTSGGQSASWSVVPGTGTGELQDLRGAARIEVTPEGQHTFTLDYALG